MAFERASDAGTYTSWDLLKALLLWMYSLQLGAEFNIRREQIHLDIQRDHEQNTVDGLMTDTVGMLGGMGGRSIYTLLPCAAA